MSYSQSQTAKDSCGLVDNTPPLTMDQLETMPEVSGGQPHSSPCEPAAFVADQPQAIPERDEGKVSTSPFDLLQSATNQIGTPAESNEGQAHRMACDPAMSDVIRLKACEAASQGDADCLSQLIKNGCSKDQMQAACCAAAKAGRVHVLRFLAEAFTHFQDCLAQVTSQHLSCTWS